MHKQILPLRSAFSDLWDIFDWEEGMANYYMVGMIGGLEGTHHDYPCQTINYKSEIDYNFSIGDSKLHARKILDKEMLIKEVYYNQTGDNEDLIKNQTGKLWRDDNNNMFKKSYCVYGIEELYPTFELSCTNLNTETKERNTITISIRSDANVEEIELVIKNKPAKIANIEKSIVSIIVPKGVSQIKLKTQSVEEILNQFQNLYVNHKLAPANHKLYATSGERIFDKVLEFKFFNEMEFHFPAFDETEINKHLLSKERYIKPIIKIESKGEAKARTF